MRIKFNGKALSAAIAAAPALVVLALNKYKQRLLIPPEQDTEPLPGDDPLEGDDVIGVTYAIEIDAPREKVWPHLNQLGQHKAGFYSFVIFERMVHFRIDNTYTIEERWQDTKVGDWCFYGDQGIGHEWVMHEPDQFYMVGMSDTTNPPTQPGAIAWLPAGLSDYAWTWGFFLQKMPRNRTRLVTRSKAKATIAEGGKLKALIVAGLMWGWSSGVMITRMLEIIKACAEEKKFLDL